MKYEALVKGILETVGGRENVLEAVHCMTRLRLRISDETKVNMDALKAVKGVLDVHLQNGQYQIVIGTHVDDVYDEFIQEAHLQAHAAVPENGTPKSEEKKRQNPFTLLMSTIASIFLPMLGVFSGAGIMRALLMAVSQLGFVSAESQTYQLIYMFSDAVFYFMPVFAAYCAAKRFKCNEFIAVALAALMIHPTFLAMVSAGESVKFFGVLPVQLVNYASQFIPILLVVYVQSWIEKYVKKWCPKVIAIFTVPLATIFITGILALTIVGPLGNLIGQAVAGGNAYVSFSVQ